MPKFFVNRDKIREDRIFIPGDDAHHIVKVLRMKEGDKLTVGDYFNTVYSCRILSLGQDGVELEILSSETGNSELPFPVTLYMALPKSDKMEWIIMKSVELGVSRIVPFSSMYTVVKLDEKNAEKKRERWQKIAKAAAEQCGRGILPTVEMPLSFRQALLDCQKQECLSFLCYEGEEHLTLKNLLEKESREKGICFFVGAEGGFDRKEVLEATRSGLPCVTLGNRILRCETAPLYVLSAIGYLQEG